MAGPTTLFQTGDHASRPAADAGCVLYWCTDHDIMYRSSGAAWATLMDLSAIGGGSVATDAIWDAAGDLALGSGANTAARLAIGSAGRLLKSDGSTAAWGLPTVFGCSAYKNASQSISNGTETPLQLDTEDYDSGGYHDNSTNNTRMTIPAGLGGKYLITGHAYYDSNTTGTRQLYFRLNGSTPVGGTHKITPIAGDNFLVVPSFVYPLSAGDYIELMTYQDSGGSRTIGDPSSYGDRYKVRFAVTFMGV